MHVAHANVERDGSKQNRIDMVRNVMLYMFWGSLILFGGLIFYFFWSFANIFSHTFENTNSTWFHLWRLRGIGVPNVHVNLSTDTWKFEMVFQRTLWLKRNWMASFSLNSVNTSIIYNPLWTFQQDGHIAVRFLMFYVSLLILFQCFLFCQTVTY